MTDYVKVIKGLECCLSDTCHGEECPYYGNGCEMKILRDALELLKEQEPRRVKSGKAYDLKFYFCPRCARPIEKSAALGEPRYCEACGQGLIWE